VAESLALCFTASLTLTHLGIGTGSLCPIVTDSRAAVVKSAYGANRSIGTGSSTVIVTESGDLCALIVLTAYGTVICSVTGGGTGGIYNRGGGVMTESGNSSLLGGSNATAGASDTGSKTGFGTGGSYCLKNNIVKMSESRNLVGNIAITAGSTGMSSVTCSFTGSL
jgi:hypothetical protein